VQRLLFIFCQWHGLAKLRLHTEASLKILKRLTTQIGEEMRAFAELTNKMDIRETPKERARRKKQSANAQLRMASTGKSKKSVGQQPTTDDDGKRKCVLNLETYKFHSMGDMVSCIERYGTSDSYSTQIVRPSLFTLEISHSGVITPFSRMNCTTVALRDNMGEPINEMQQLR
jgi:hypothetical protein